MESEVWRLDLSAEALRAMTTEQRYAFALSSHVFNELMLLQKWVHISRRPPGDPGPQEDAAVGVTMFLVRLLASKLYEALHHDALRRPAVDAILRADYFGRVDGLTARWDAALADHDAVGWLGWVRNKGGFHYMNPNQWNPHLEGTICDGAYIYVGRRYGDTYFHWSEMSAALPAMSHVNPNEPFEGLAQMVQDLGRLLGEVTDCLARGIQAFLNGNGVGGTLSEPIRFQAPMLEPPALHYFFGDDRLQAPEPAA